MWFGKFTGMRLDQLTEHYRRSIVHLSYKDPSRNVSMM